MSIPLFVVDAFTDRPFAGNPAAVCLLPAWRDERWLHNVAREMNLSETAFLVQRADGFDLRWFTPSLEVDLCGHATLASAHVVWQQKWVSPQQPISFFSRSGLLKAARHGNEIVLDFPLKPEEPCQAPANLVEALGITPKYVGRNRLDYLVEAESEAVLRALAPDFKKVATVPVRGVIVTCRSSEPRFDFVSRFFAPAAGIDEDPVTGSAHCCLGAFWSQRLGKSELVAYQASARGGVVRVRVAGDRAFLGGQAVTVTAGKLLAEE
jgi:PhzF family phenazine biosynthesis protein